MEIITKTGVDISVCHYCLAPIDEYSRTVDHAIPKSRGGVLSNSNKIPSCITCNQLKGDMTIEEFERSLTSMIHFESVNHRKTIGYLKKVKYNVAKISEKFKTN